MRIHTDKINGGDLYTSLPPGVFATLTDHGSRSRARAFQVGLLTYGGVDAYGNKRRHRRNMQHIVCDEPDVRAATWMDWGDWIARLFEIDPEAIIGCYKGVEDYIEQTAKASTYRPETDLDGVSPWAYLADGVAA